MAETKINPLGDSSSGYALQETVTYSANATKSFNIAAGVHYKLVYYLVGDGSVGGAWLKCTFNNDTGSYYQSGIHFSSAAGAHSVNYNTGPAGLWSGSTCIANTPIYGEASLYSVAGASAFLVWSQGIWISTSYWAGASGSVNYTHSGATMSSMQIFIESGSFTGMIHVLKLVV